MWRLKVLIQAILARLPYGESLNHMLQRVNEVRRGDAWYQNRLVEIAESIDHLETIKPLAGADIVEVGSGWDAMPTVYLAAGGAAKIHSFDHLPHLRADLATKAAKALSRRFPNNPLLTKLSSGLPLDAFLKAARVDYRAPSDATDTKLPPSSVDIYFSYAVLEHVPDDVAQDIIREAKRILKPDGVFFALIGLHDHYNGFDRRVSKVNFLKYPEWLWALLVKNSISYHNRLRERDFLEMLAREEAIIVDVRHVIDPQDVERVKAMKIDKRFRGYSPEELATTRTELTARFSR